MLESGWTLHMSYLSKRFGIDIVIQNLLLLIHYTSTFQTYYRLIKPYLCQYTMRCSSYILFLLACFYAVPAIYFSKSQKEAKSQCVSPKGEKLFKHFWKKNTVAGRLMYPRYDETRNSKSCVCVFFSCSFTRNVATDSFELIYRYKFPIWDATGYATHTTIDFAGDDIRGSYRRVIHAHTHAFPPIVTESGHTRFMFENEDIWHRQNAGKMWNTLRTHKYSLRFPFCTHNSFPECVYQMCRTIHHRNLSNAILCSHLFIPLHLIHSQARVKCGFQFGIALCHTSAITLSVAAVAVAEEAAVVLICLSIIYFFLFVICRCFVCLLRCRQANESCHRQKFGCCKEAWINLNLAHGKNISISILFTQ